MDVMPQLGQVEWIGLRAGKRAELESVQSVIVTEENGLEGDHYSKIAGKRQVTLIQKEHLDVVANILNIDAVNPGLTRRNIVVSGLNLLALKERKFQIGDVTLEMTGFCYPCSRMEENLGPGGYNAMRGHGGINAKVVQGGTINVGDKVVAILKEAEINA